MGTLAIILFFAFLSFIFLFSDFTIREKDNQPHPLIIYISAFSLCVAVILLVIQVLAENPVIVDPSGLMEITLVCGAGILIFFSLLGLIALAIRLPATKGEKRKRIKGHLDSTEDYQ